MLEQCLRVDLHSFVPVTTQLGEQIKHLIAQRVLKPGDQLPSVRDLAASLGINRNTVAKAVEDLERAGYLRAHRGKGIYVADRPPSSLRDSQMVDFLDDTLRKADLLGLEPESLAVALLARAHRPQGLPAASASPLVAAEAAPALDVAPPPPVMATLPVSHVMATPPAGRAARLLLVECNQPQLEQFRQDLQEALSVGVETLLIDDLKRLIAKPYEARRLARFDAAVTTFYHAQEVASLLAAYSVRVVPVLAEIHPRTLQRLASLPAGSVVGVACVNWSGAGSLRAGIENAGLRHLQAIQGCTAVPPSLKSMFERARVVVCSSLALPELETYKDEHGFGQVEFWVEDRRLDPRSLAELGRELAWPLRA